MFNNFKKAILLPGAIVCAALLFSCAQPEKGEQVTQDEWNASFEELSTIKERLESEGEYSKLEDDNIQTRAIGKIISFGTAYQLSMNGFIGGIETRHIIARGLEISYISSGLYTNQKPESSTDLVPAIDILYSPDGRDGRKAYRYFQWRAEDNRNMVTNPKAYSSDYPSALDTGFKWEEGYNSDVGAFGRACYFFSELRDRYSQDKWDSSKGMYKFEVYMGTADSPSGAFVFNKPQNFNASEDVTYNMYVRFDGAKKARLISLELGNIPAKLKNNKEFMKENDKKITMYIDYLSKGGVFTQYRVPAL